MYQQKDAQDGTARQEAKTKTKEDIHGCGEKTYADSWFERRCRWPRGIKNDDLLLKLQEKK